MMEYTSPKKYEGNCVICNHKNSTWDWDNKLSTKPLSNMYCSYCRQETMHNNIKRVEG